MAKRRANAPKPNRRPPRPPAPPPDYSLEAILAEYRTAPDREETQALSPAQPMPDAEAAPRDVPEAPAYAPQDEYPAEPAYASEEQENAPEEPAYAPAEDGGAYPPEEPPDGAEEEPAYASDDGAGDAAADDIGEAPEGLSDDESVEGFEEHSDLYAQQTVEPPEETWRESGEYTVHPGKTAARGGPLHRLYGRLIATLAVATYRREQDRGEREPEPEDNENEMPAREAARHYAGQMPALKRRARTAFPVMLLAVWIALGHGAGLSLPGALGTDLRCAALVSAVALLTVMLLALDVVTNGILALFRGRPGAETLIAVACLGSLADAVYTVAAKDTLGALPPCAVPCVALWLALRGAYQDCRVCRAGFLALSRAEAAYAVTGERLLNRKNIFLIKSRQSLDGFVRRSEEPNVCEMVSAFIAPFLLVMALILAGLVTISARSVSVLPHAFAVMTAVSASWCALAVFPWLFARAADHFMRNGTAVAGWSGLRDVGVSRHLILTDSDLFPEGTVAISGVRILEGAFTDQVVAFTGSVLAAAGTEVAGLFTGMMKRSGGTLHTVEGFTVGEGGAQAYIEGTEIYVGGAGYMYLHGVKIPPKLVSTQALYTAFNGALVGYFSLSYTPTASVSEALRTLHRARSKPIFAARDFNVDPKMVKEKFHCEIDGFEFPPVPERYVISDVPASGDNPAAAFVTGGGLGRLVDLAARGRHLYRCGIVCAVLTGLSALLGLVLCFLLGWSGAWSLLSAARLLLYMLVWLLPAILMTPNTR